jgi:Uma2 family endonuclease
MPTALIETLSPPAPLVPPRKLWTRAECAALETAGLLDGQHLELIDGELINRMGKHRPHVNSLTLLMGWLVQVFGVRFVNPESPIDVAPEDNPSNEPQPDIMVLKRDLAQIVSANPRPEDLQLVVEVADTTMNFDLTTKAALYARAGVVEYWVLDIKGRRLIVHREAGRMGYASIVVYGEHESVAPLSAPQSEFRVSAAFPA